MSERTERDALRVAIIGLDTSHSVEFPRLMQAPETAPETAVTGLHAVSCLRFPSPFQTEEGQDRRQAQLESWGVRVTRDADEALADCDAIMLEINDPALHLEWFARVAALGLPVFLDKPLAGTVEDGRRIVELARRHGTRVWSGSSLPFAPALAEARRTFGDGELPVIGHCFGPYGQAPAGDSLVWYGVHTFEMLQRVMGAGARRVQASDHGYGVVATVDYGDGRFGGLELIRSRWSYGGRLQRDGLTVPFVVDASRLYRDMLLVIRDFLRGGAAPVTLETTFEGLAMMAAAGDSLHLGGWQTVETLG